VSYETLRKGTDVQSANTVRKLIEMQEDHFSLKHVTRIDPDTGKSLAAKLRKIYPLDPFVAHVYRLIATKTRRLMFESAAAAEISAEAAFLAQTYEHDPERSVGFLYSDRSHGEVEFFFDGMGFELKSRGSPTKAQSELLRKVRAPFVVTARTLPTVAYLTGSQRF
jgi:predicted AAA+ superfamily ATPase